MWRIAFTHRAASPTMVVAVLAALLLVEIAGLILSARATLPSIQAMMPGPPSDAKW